MKHIKFILLAGFLLVAIGYTGIGPSDGGIGGNTVPITVAGDNKNVLITEEVTLDGSDSFDAEESPLT